MARFSLPKTDSKDAKYKLSQETADAQVAELLEHYEIDVDELPPDQGAIMLAVCAKLSRYYRLGLLENVRDGATLKVKQHLSAPPGDVREVVYGRMTGAAKLATDGYTDTQRYAARHALMGALSGLGSGAMASLQGNDASAMECLASLFLNG